MRLWLIYIFTIKSIISANPTPIVLWHGMGDTCCSSFSLGGFKTFLERTISGVYVHSLKIGNNTIEDLENGYFMSPNEQITFAYNILKNDPNLRGGFNVIGFSQGSQFLRALVQRYGHLLPPVRNMISLGGQQQGIYGIPHCGALLHKSCDYIRKLLNHAAYYGWVQKRLVQATYWHDPLDEQTYKEKSEFLSDINNELSINHTYIDNLSQLYKFVLVKFNKDSIMEPKESSWFGFYKPGQSKILIPLQRTRLYREDRIGLQQMDREQKLVFLSINSDHLRFTDTWFIDNIIKPFLYERINITNVTEPAELNIITTSTVKI